MAEETEKKKKKKGKAEGKAEKNPVLKSAIQDIVHHTASLGVFDAVRIRTGDDGTILLDAIDSDLNVAMCGRMKKNVPEFEGHYFGFGKLGHFDKLLKLENYAGEGGTVRVGTTTRKVRKFGKKETEILESFVFEDSDGNRDTATLLDPDHVDHAIGREAKEFNGKEWEVTIEPDASKVEQMMQAAAIYASLKVEFFGVRTEGSDLLFEFISKKTGTAGRRVFASGVDGTLEGPRMWDIATFQKVIRLGMNREGCSIHFSGNRAVMMIRIDSGVAVYDYILLGKMPEDPDDEA